MTLDFPFKKTYFSYTTTLATDIATIGLWAYEETKDIDFMVDKPYERLKGKYIGANTKSDGQFRVHVNYNSDLEDHEKKLVYKKSMGILIDNPGELFIGDVGQYLEDPSHKLSSYSRGMVDKLVFPAGKYVLDIYSLVIPDKEGNPEYIQFAFNIFPEDNYKEAQKDYATSNAELEYSE